MCPSVLWLWAQVQNLSLAPAAPRMTSFHTQSELKDPLGQKMENIQSFLRQPQEAHRMNEVFMLNSNLQQLEDSLDLVYAGNQQQDDYEEPAEKRPPKAEKRPFSLSAFPTFMAQEMPPRLRSLGGHVRWNGQGGCFCNTPI